jgi:hypothetical protein
MKNNVQRTIEAISEWLLNVGASALPQVKISSQSGVGRLMAGVFGIDISSYSVWDELGFLLGPAVKKIVAPKMAQLLSAIPEEGYTETIMAVVDSAIEQAQAKGYVDIFGIQLGENTFVGLKEILESKLKN